jgi:hypothetical protein
MDPLTYGTVTARFRNEAPGYFPPKTGSVSFVPVAIGPRAVDAPPLPSPVKAHLRNEAFTVDLPATDASWTYHLAMDFNIPGDPWGHRSFRHVQDGYYRLDVPAGVVTDFATMKPTGKKYVPRPAPSSRFTGEIGSHTYQ